MLGGRTPAPGAFGRTPNPYAVRRVPPVVDVKLTCAFRVVLEQVAGRQLQGLQVQVVALLLPDGDRVARHQDGKEVVARRLDRGWGLAAEHLLGPPPGARHPIRMRRLQLPVRRHLDHQTTHQRRRLGYVIIPISR